MDDGDYVLSKQLWRAAAKLSSLNVLENGAELLMLFLNRVYKILRQTSFFG